jgi:peptide/nickel transport system permease protein
MSSALPGVDRPGINRPAPVPQPARDLSWRSRLPRSMTISGMIGLLLVVFWLLIALLGPMLAPHTVGSIVSYEVFAPVGTQHLLGTDYLGRDMLSRVLHGARFTVGLALAAALLASITGTALGVFAAVSGRWIDEALSRLLDALICIPSKIFALVMVAAFGSSLPLLLITAGLSYLPGAFRIARSLAVNLNTMDYVQVARARGEGRLYLTWVEILPNMIHPMLADFGLRFVFVVLLLSGLSFLGLGVQPPDADLGSLVRENISGLPEGAPAVVAPALAIATLTIGVNLLIDSLAGKAKRAGE